MAAQVISVPEDKHKNSIMTLSDIGLNGYIRITRNGGRLRFSEIDVVKVATGKDNDQAGLVIRRFSDETIQEIEEDSAIFKFKGRGQQDTTTITYTGVIKLIMNLPGQIAKKLRTEFADVLLRYFAGDASLLEEIERNRESHNPINEAAREALHEVRGDDELQMEQMQRIRDELKKEVLTEMVKFVKKNEVADRRKQLNDEARTHKRKLELIMAEKDKAEHVAEVEIKKEKAKMEIAAQVEKTKMENAARIQLSTEQKQIDMLLQKQEDELELMVKRLPVEKQYHEMQKDKFEQEMKLKSMERDRQSVRTAPSIGIPEGELTMGKVGKFYGIFNGMRLKFMIRIANSARSMIEKHPYNVEPLGEVEDTLIGKMHSHYDASDIPTMKKVLEFCKMDESHYDDIYEKNEVHVPSAVLLAQ